MTDYKAQIDEARRAQAAVYLATESDVADDLSRIIKGLADAVEALEQRALAAEARIEKVRANWSRRYSDTGNLLPDATEAITAALAAAQSGLVEDMRRNTAAQAIEDFAADLLEWYPEGVFPTPTDENYHDLHVALARSNITLDRFSADLMRRAAGIAAERAAEYRTGDSA